MLPVSSLSILPDRCGGIPSSSLPAPLRDCIPNRNIPYILLYLLLERLLDKMIYNYVGTSVDEIDLNSLLEQKCKEEEEHEKVN